MIASTAELPIRSTKQNSVLSTLTVWITFVVWTVWAYWLFQYPLEFGHDDALFFARGIEHFSVVELSPHFPGYPGFIALASVVSLFETAEASVVLTSLLSAVVIPWLLVLLFLEQTEKKYTSCSALFLITMTVTQPLLAAMALSGLSDVTGLAFFIVSLIYCYRNQYTLSGLLLGMMLACRPSFFPLAVGLLIAIPLLICRQQRLFTAYSRGLLGIVLVGTPCLMFVLAKDGVAYFEEGLRFTQGHFQIWGNTVASELPVWQQWLRTLTELYGWPVVALFTLSLLAGLLLQRTRLLSAIIVVYLGWILLAQNPDNLRHFAPALLLWLTVLTYQLQQLTDSLKVTLSVSFISASIVMFYNQTIFTVTDSPARQAQQWFNDQPLSTTRVIGTNYSVSILREELPKWQIYDMYYPSSELVLQQAQGYRLSGTRQQELQLIAEFPGRFTGEQTLYLYQYVNPVSRITGKSIDLP